MRSAASRESAARRYRIEKYLTEGGMGAIYLGKKMGSGGFQKEVVLKQLLPEYTARPEFRDLFFREAKISATLDHANIVHTFDLVESDQSLFIVMEYVRGADLRTILRRARQRHRDLSPAAAIHIVLEILAGLSYAHTRRDRRGVSLDIIHRDVSPSNIICSAQGEAKLSDFGIAKASTHSSVFYRVRGKVGYMSPEQARSQPIDHRCDLYSLSVCLYESLSGERLFVGDLSTPADEIYGHPIVPISEKRRGLPAALDAVLAKALAPNIAERHQSAGELSDALRTVAHKTGLAFSAPELAAHLREILGDNPERWLRDDGGHAPPEANKIPPASVGLVGREAASIGIVADAPEDADPPLVLSPRAVSGSKDFDIDSMLSDEATRPGNVIRPGAAPGPSAGPGSGPVPRSEAVTPRPRRTDRRPATPPPVWTRSSGPIPIVTPPPAEPPAAAPAPAPARAVAQPARKASAAPAARAPAARAKAPAARSTSTRATAPAIPPPPPPASGRPLPRATMRGMPIPPPIPPAASAPVASAPVAPPPVAHPRTSAPPPPPPPVPIGAARPHSPFGPEFEETPPPPAHVASFDIEESPMDARPRRPADTLLGSGPAPTFGRSHPPSGYPSPAAPAQSAYDDPPRLSQPETIDFSGSATLPEKKSGPPRWLVLAGLVLGLVGGGALGHRVTRDQVAGVQASVEEAAARAGRGANRAPAELPPADSSKPAPPPAEEPRQPKSLGLPVVGGQGKGQGNDGSGVAAGAQTSGAAKRTSPAVRPHASKGGGGKRHPAAIHKKPARRH